MAMNTLSINGTDISTYGIYISSDTYLNAPRIDYSEFQIPAKDGTTILDNKRMDNVIRRFDCYVPESGNVDTAMNNLKKLLYQNRGYLLLNSSYEPGWYQYGYLAQEITVVPFKKNGSVQFSLYFSCFPVKYAGDNAFHSTTHQEINTALSIRISNDNTILVKILAQANQDYPYSPIGWARSYTDYNKILSEGSYTVTCTSSTTQKYIVVLMPDLIMGNYEIIGEVRNYGDTFSFNVPASVGTEQYYVGVIYPITENNQRVEFTISNGITDVLAFNYNDITSSDFTNNSAIGVKPVFMYKKPVTHYNYDGGMDVLVVNGNMYVVDYVKLCQDYGVQVIRNTAVHYDSVEDKNYIYVYADLNNGKLLFLDAFDPEANINIDASNYFMKYSVGLFNSSVITAKFATGSGVDGGGGVFTASEIENIECQAGWWKL